MRPPWGSAQALSRAQRGCAANYKEKSRWRRMAQPCAPRRRCGDDAVTAALSLGNFRPLRYLEVTFERVLVPMILPNML